MLKTYKYPQIPDQDKEGTGNVLLGVQDGESLTPLTLSTGGNNSAIISFTAVKFNQFKKEVDRIDLDTSLIAIDLTNNIYKVDGLTDYTTALENGMYRFEFQNNFNLWKTEYFKVIDKPLVDTAFKFTINTALGSGTTMALPLINSETYNFTVNYGDGSGDKTVVAYNDANATYDYGVAFTGQITITGKCGGWAFNNTGDKLKIISVDNWGVGLEMDYIRGMFWGCTNLSVLPISGSIPATTSVIQLIALFQQTAITYLYSGLLDLCTEANTIVAGFWVCSSLTGADEGLLHKLTKLTAVSNMFIGDINFVNIPNDLFYYNPLITAYSGVLQNCYNLILPTRLFNLASLSIVTSFNSFMSVGSVGSSGTGTIQDIWNYALSATSTNTFLNQTSFTNYASIPNAWKGL